MKSSTIIILLMLYNLTVFGCSCNNLKRISKAEYKSAGAVFIGKVIGIQENKGNKLIEFEVTDWLKTNQESSHITISTAKYSASCGLTINEGEQWYIFAYIDDSFLHASRCGRSIQLDKIFEDQENKFSQFEQRQWNKKMKRFKQDRRFLRRMRLISHIGINRKML